MGVDIFFTGIDMFRVGVASQIFAHLFGIIHHHLIMQGADLVLGMQVVQLLDVEIAEAEGLFQLHAVLPAQPGDHGGGDDKMVFQVQHRVPGKLAYALPFPEAAQLAVVAHGVHIGVGHRPVELVFFAGIPVLHLIHFIVGLQKQPFLLVTHLTRSFLRQAARYCPVYGMPDAAFRHISTFIILYNIYLRNATQDIPLARLSHIGQKTVMDLIFFVRF